MTDSTLNVLERTETLRECRDGDFIPAVLYGSGFEEGKSIKVQRSSFMQLLKEQGESATLWLQVGDQKQYALVKEVQKNLMRGEVLHVDFQAICQDEEIQIKIPVIFEGREQLEGKRLILQIIKSEIDIIGKANQLPENVEVQVGELEPGGKVVAEDLVMPEGIKLLEDPEETLAIITAPNKEEEEEEATEDTTTGDVATEE